MTITNSTESFSSEGVQLTTGKQLNKNANNLHQEEIIKKFTTDEFINSCDWDPIELNFPKHVPQAMNNFAEEPVLNDLFTQEAKELIDCNTTHSAEQKLSAEFRQIELLCNIGNLYRSVWDVPADNQNQHPCVASSQNPMVNDWIQMEVLPIQKFDKNPKLEEKRIYKASSQPLLNQQLKKTMGRENN